MGELFAYKKERNRVLVGGSEGLKEVYFQIGMNVCVLIDSAQGGCNEKIS